MLPNQHQTAISQFIAKNPSLEQPQIFEIDATKYVIKPQRRESGRTWREYASAISAFLLFGQLISPKKLRTDGIAHEARRLKELKAAGVRVPEVYIENKDYIVIEFCGKSCQHTMDCLIEKKQILPFYALPQAGNKYGDQVDKKIIGYIEAAVENLIELHQLKQWHGGAQVRNLTLKDDVIYRIDFEENTGNAMPLALAQAYDVLLSFNSLAPFMRNDVKTGVRLMTKYLEQTNSHETIKYLKKINRLLRTAKKITPLFTKKMKNKSDIINTLYFAEILNLSLNS